MKTAKGDKGVEIKTKIGLIRVLTTKEENMLEAHGRLREKTLSNIYPSTQSTMALAVGECSLLRMLSV